MHLFWIYTLSLILVSSKLSPRPGCGTVDILTIEIFAQLQISGCLVHLHKFQFIYLQDSVFIFTSFKTTNFGLFHKIARLKSFNSETLCLWFDSCCRYFFGKKGSLSFYFFPHLKALASQDLNVRFPFALSVRSWELWSGRRTTGSRWSTSGHRAPPSGCSGCWTTGRKWKLLWSNR